jgi:acyl-CoA hydrolase
MDNFAIVRPEHLNHYGRLFGGAILRWVDEFAWLVASLDFPHCSLVTVGMDRVEFKEPAAAGSILRFRILPAGQGTTSVTYSVDVHADEPGAETEKFIFSTRITFVRVDADGRKCPLPPQETYRSAGGQSGAAPR